MNNSFAQKCKDNNLECGKAYKFKARHSNLTDEQIIEYYREKIDYSSVRLGEKNTARQGLIIELIKYRNSHDIDIQFEDGTIVEHKTYTNFKKGYIPHPKYIKVEEAFRYEGKKYFLCKCRVCKGLHVLCLGEMKDFECDITNKE